MRLLLWPTLRLPALSRIRRGLKRPGLIGAPHGAALPFAYLVGLLDEFFFASVSGSVTGTTPDLRLRWTVPVSHQVRLACQLKPASCKTIQIV